MKKIIYLSSLGFTLNLLCFSYSAGAMEEKTDRCGIVARTHETAMTVKHGQWIKNANYREQRVSLGDATRNDCLDRCTQKKQEFSTWEAHLKFFECIWGSQSVNI